MKAKGQPIVEPAFPRVKPVLRWAGGKSWLIDRIRSHIPEIYDAYYEPFAGAASVFLNLINTDQAHLADLNHELIDFYHQVQNNLQGLLATLREYQNDEQFFYQLRQTESADPLIRAARFYYLNRTCFNGLYRVNLSGQFNVPYGYRTVDIIDEEGFVFLNKKLSGVNLLCQDFASVIDMARKQDFVFLDPPYTVAHNHNGFIQYNQKIFSWHDQERLAAKTRELCKKDVRFIMTNACHDSIKTLYKGIGNLYEVDRQSTISGKNKSRAKVSEVIITNIF
ncbi:MAG TPA: Dam family site-specific DNA-(adenine-N6)-methyltransferase [Mucilaginibacter sp.]|jgi:DNA adenine methylase